MPVTFTMSKEDSELVLEHVTDLDEAIRARLRFGLAEGNRLRYTLSEEQFDILLDCIDDAASLSDKRRVRRMLGSILDKLEAYLPDTEDDEEWEEEIEEEGIDFTAPWLAFIREQVEGVLERMKEASPREIQAEVERVLEVFGNQPNEELAGYTPNQLQRLKEADWDRPDCPIQCRGDLTIEQVSDNRAFQDMRLFLRMLSEEGGTTKATSTGSLNRAFVRRFVDEMPNTDERYAVIVPDKKILNENDVVGLWKVHRIAYQLELVVWSDKLIRLTERGASMLEDTRAGELFREYFICHWQAFDSDVIYGVDLLDEVTSYATCMLYGFSMHGRVKAPFEVVAEKIIPRLLLRMIEEVIEEPMGFLRAVFYSRVFSPLRDFGLADVETLPDADDNDPTIMQCTVFTTPLFDAFFSFDIE